MNAEAKINDTMVMTLMTMFIDGPEVSLNGYTRNVLPNTVKDFCSDIRQNVGAAV